jgi:pimeloyl-ACP methyl ester carboxylesterase
MPMLFSPTVGAAITAGYWFLWVRCPACRTINAIDLRTLDRHRDAAVTSLIPALSCRSCRPNAPFAALDHRPLLAKICAPTLVIAGKQDPATPLEANEFICQHIADASLAVLDAAHIANIEQPRVYTDTVLKFLLK